MFELELKKQTMIIAQALEFNFTKTARKTSLWIAAGLLIRNLETISEDIYQKDYRYKEWNLKEHKES